VLAGAQKVPPSKAMPSMLPPLIATLLAACVAIEPRPRLDRALAAFVRSERFADFSSLPASPLVTVLAKLGSSPKAAASSLSVSSAPGAASTSAAMAACTKAVLAICVVLVLGEAVGAVGVPVKVGEAGPALSSNAPCRDDAQKKTRAAV
jgi:hypothetical protein